LLRGEHRPQWQAEGQHPAAAQTHRRGGGVEQLVDRDGVRCGGAGRGRDPVDEVEQGGRRGPVKTFVVRVETAQSGAEHHRDGDQQRADEGQQAEEERHYEVNAEHE
jgi:hypothetical protein